MINNKPFLKCSFMNWEIIKKQRFQLRHAEFTFNLFGPIALQLIQISEILGLKVFGFEST